jgi:hypothetical protein
MADVKNALLLEENLEKRFFRAMFVKVGKY